jgi:hypothetical protein
MGDLKFQQVFRARAVRKLIAEILAPKREVADLETTAKSGQSGHQ